MKIKNDRYEEVLFCLSNQKLMEDYASLTTGTSSTVFYLQNSLFDDNGDIRLTNMVKTSGNYQVCTKNIAPVAKLEIIRIVKTCYR